MAKKLSKLQMAQQKAEAAAKKTNQKIDELGKHTSALYTALTQIQSLFDRIRNVPEENRLKYEKLKAIRVNWKQQAEKIELEYKKAEVKAAGQGAAGIGAGVAVAALGPTAAMGIATTFGVASTGTAISALSGAAATNAALAWLGGGALAAGGGGMAAGSAFLALAGPVGWAIAGVSVVASGLMFFKSKGDKERLENVYTLIQRALRLQCDPSEVWQIIQEKATQLQNRLLLVIDNVENPEEDEYLKKISVLQCNILVTSRQKELQGFSDILYLQPLSELSCRKLFYKHYQFDERDDNVLNDIISLTAHLTIMIVFIAKVAYLEGLALHELYGRLVEKGFKLSEEDVSCEHERLQNDDTIIRQMCILFSLVKYSDADKTILTYVSIIPNLRFEFKQAKQWFRIQKNSSLMKLYKMGMLEHITNNRKHIYWMHSVIAAAVREQQKEHLYTLSRPFVDILCEELNTGRVFGKEYEKAYLIPFSWSIADIMEKHWCVEDDTDYLTSLFHICFSCSNYILCEKIIDIVIRVQTDNPAFTAEDLAYSYRNKIDLLMQFDKVEEAAPLFKEVERLMSITDLPENKRNILSYQYGIYNQIRGKYDKAREYFRYCIDCAEKEESITREKDISTAYANMARMLVEAGDFFEAYKCIKKAINAEKEDELDSDQIVCYSTLAGICTELMQAGYGTTYIDEAIAAFDKVIKFREKHLGKHHTDTAVIYHDYSYFWYVCGVLDKALEYNEKAYKIDEELFAEHSITRMRTLNTKALIIWDQGDYDKACSTLEYIIKTTEQMGNNYLVDLFDFSFNYARCLHEKGNDTLSKEYYNKCIDIWDSMSGGGSRNLCLVFQEYGDILFSEMNPGEALSKYESALKYNTEDWYIEVDLIDSIAACMMLIGQTDESLQKFAWLLQTLAEDDVKDAETKFQLCNNLACVLNSETEEEIEYKESLFDLVKDDAAVLSYAIHYLDDWLPDSAE